MSDVMDRLIEMNGLRFHYRDWPAQSPNAEVLVLLHGYTGHARSWDWFAQHMTDRFHVLALDQRGHGETGWAAPEDYGTSHMVADLRAFVTAMGLDGFNLLGLSMGGNVAIHYAGAGPAELNRLVIVDIGPELSTRGVARIQTSVVASDVFDTEEEAFQRARAANERAPDDHLRHRVINNLMKLQDGRWTFRYDRALRDASIQRPRPSTEEAWQAVANIAVPTLLIRGEESDILSEETASRMVEEIGDCTLQTVTGSGHSVPLDKPEGFLEAVRGFL